MESRQLRIMTIGAHPDDCELTTGGTCLMYTALGHQVKYVYATNGDAGHQRFSGSELASIRAAEAANGCAIGGFEHEIMENHDGYLDTGIRNRDSLIRLIRRFRPDLIFTHRTNDYHTDHRCAGQLVQDASYLLMVPNICPDVPALDFSPIIMHVADSFTKPVPFEATVAVRIDPVFAQKMQMVACHRSQFFEWLPWIGRYEGEVPSEENTRLAWLSEQVGRWDASLADRVRPRLLARYGVQAEVTHYAEAFERSEYGGLLTDEMLQVLFPF